MPLPLDKIAYVAIVLRFVIRLLFKIVVMLIRLTGKIFVMIVNETIKEIKTLKEEL